MRCAGLEKYWFLKKELADVQIWRVEALFWGPGMWWTYARQKSEVLTPDTKGSWLPATTQVK